MLLKYWQKFLHWSVFRPVEFSRKKALVLSSGYLLPEHFNSPIVEQALNAAAAGVEPSFFDNSKYARVSPEYAGQTLVKVVGKDWQLRVYTLTGKLVTSTADTPLAYARWGEPEPVNDYWYI